MKSLHLLLSAGIATALIHSLPARADVSSCAKQVRAQGYFITDIDSDWGRPYDKFEVIKDGKEYDLWVNKNTCKIEKKMLDDRYDRFND